MNKLKIVPVLCLIILSGCYMPRWARWGEKRTAPSPEITVTPSSTPADTVKVTPAPDDKRYFQRYHSLTWKEEVNLTGIRDEGYPKVVTITSRTMRKTIDEYYVPMLSEQLHMAVDYYETLDTLDDAFLKQYHFDIYSSPESDTVNLMWKGKF